MNRSLSLLLAWTLLTSAAVAQDVVPPLSERDIEHIVFLTHQSPVFIRLHLRVDDKSFQESWHNWSDGLFDECDVNHDGRLDARETATLPNTDELLGAASDSRRSPPALKRPDEFASKQQFAAYIADVASPIALTVQSAALNSDAGNTNVGEELFVLLDQNQDGKVTQAEFAFGSRLRKLDIDDDESLSLAELAYARGNVIARPLTGSATSSEAIGKAEFRQFDQRVSLAHTLIWQYDRPVGQSKGETKQLGDGMLSAEELDVAASDFSPHDRDGNQLLDFDELLQFLRDPVPDVEGVVWFASSSNSRARIDWLPARGSVKAVIAADGLLARIGDCSLTISVANSRTMDPSMVVSQARRIFESADTDKNGYLEESEANGIAYFRGRFSAMDRDNDKKVYAEEMLFITRQQAIVQSSRISVAVADSGRNIFQIADANRDGRVDGPELAEAGKQLPAWDRNGDGRIGIADIPRAWRMVISRGSSMPVIGRPGEAYSRTSDRPGAVPTPGPVWFQRMDRNQDGRVSRREFLFNVQHFEKLDVNQDGFLDFAEALMRGNAG